MLVQRSYAGPSGMFPNVSCCLEKVLGKKLPVNLMKHTCEYDHFLHMHLRRLQHSIRLALAGCLRGCQGSNWSGCELVQQMVVEYVHDARALDGSLLCVQWEGVETSAGLYSLSDVAVADDDVGRYVPRLRIQQPAHWVSHELHSACCVGTESFFTVLRHPDLFCKFAVRW